MEVHNFIVLIGLAAQASARLRFCPVLVTEPAARLAANVDFTFNHGAARPVSTPRR